MTKEIKIGDCMLRRHSSDKFPQLVEFIVNKTYLNLIKEFPEDYKYLNKQDGKKNIC